MAAARALAESLLDALPQTQCRRCGYDDCRGYAEAIAHADADIDRCPPGGAEGVERLARLTGRPPRPIDTTCGVEGPRSLARIDESACIGCALCLKACPTDAIIGANKRMHTVVAAECTGCELCLPVCPVDCIVLVPAASGPRTGWKAWSTAEADRARRRYAVHQWRAAQPRDAVPAAPVGPDTAPRTDAQRRQDAVAAALARARAARGTA